MTTTDTTSAGFWAGFERACDRPAGHLARSVHDQREQYRLEIVVDPDPDVPAALVTFYADGIAAAIATARRLLAAVDGPGDQYGELYQRIGETTDFLTTIHLGA